MRCLYSKAHRWKLCCKLIFFQRKGTISALEALRDALYKWTTTTTTAHYYANRQNHRKIFQLGPVA